MEKWKAWTLFSEVSSMETFYVPITLVSTSVCILSSWVQLSESTSARGRSEELLHYLFVPRGTCVDVGTCTEGKRFRFGLSILNWCFRFPLDMSPDVCVASPCIGINTGVFPWVTFTYLYKTQNHPCSLVVMLFVCILITCGRRCVWPTTWLRPECSWCSLRFHVTI